MGNALVDGQQLSDQPAAPDLVQPEPPARSVWELIDEEWEEGERVPMCM